MNKVSEIFDVFYPSTLVYGHYKDKVGQIPFVTSKGTDNGVAGYVQPIKDARIYKANSITVPLKGTVLQAHLQVHDFYCAHQIAILVPKTELSLTQLLYYVFALRANKYRFSYGRQADRTLKDLLIPSVEEIPDWLEEIDLSYYDEFSKPAKLSLVDYNENILKNTKFSYIPLKDVFEVRYGVNLELNKLKLNPEGINFVSRTSRNNGVSAKVSLLDGVEPIPGGVLTVAGGGSVLETFLQDEPFYSGRDLYYLAPKVNLSPQVMLFYSAVIMANKFRYSYGRQANRTIKDIKVPAPTNDFLHFADDFMNSLPYSSQLCR